MRSSGSACPHSRRVCGQAPHSLMPPPLRWAEPVGPSPTRTSLSLTSPTVASAGTYLPLLHHLSSNGHPPHEPPVTLPSLRHRHDPRPIAHPRPLERPAGWIGDRHDAGRRRGALAPHARRLCVAPERNNILERRTQVRRIAVPSVGDECRLRDRAARWTAAMPARTVGLGRWSGNGRQRGRWPLRVSSVVKTRWRPRRDGAHEAPSRGCAHRARAPTPYSDGARAGDHRR